MKYRIASAFTVFSTVAFGQQVEHFESTVLPILKANCLACHSDKSPASGLSLQSREMLLRGGNRGADPRVIAEAVKQSGELKMPPGKKLTPEQIASIEKWVGDGLPMPHGSR